MIGMSTFPPIYDIYGDFRWVAWWFYDDWANKNGV